MTGGLVYNAEACDATVVMLACVIDVLLLVLALLKFYTRVAYIHPGSGRWAIIPPDSIEAGQADRADEADDPTELADICLDADGE